MASELQSQIIHFLKARGRCWVIKVISANERGCPDLLCCYRGRFLAIEIKEMGDKLTPIQGTQLELIQVRAGGFSMLTEGRAGIRQVEATLEHIDALIDGTTL